jgi:hypothetical protein
VDEARAQYLDNRVNKSVCAPHRVLAVLSTAAMGYGDGVRLPARRLEKEEQHSDQHSPKNHSDRQATQQSSWNPRRIEQPPILVGGAIVFRS